MSNVTPAPQAASPSKQAGKIYEKLYKPGRFLFTAPDHIDAFVKRITTKENANILQKVLVNPVAKALGWFTGNFLRYDYNKMIPVGKLRVAQAPIGALMMMFLPFTIAPRMVQALKRGEGDKSEFWDILRRDVPTIGLLLFALDPLVKGLNLIKQKFDGMAIVEPKTTTTPGGAVKKAFGEVFSYSKLKQIFNIDRPHTLYEIASQGNAKGMRNALEKITKQWSTNPHLGVDKAKDISTFNKTVAEMLDEVAKGKDANAVHAKELSGKAFSLMQKLDKYRASRYGSLSEKELPKLTSFLVRHARTRRLPIDILSFVMVAIGVGFMPVWFNDLWSRKKHAEKQATPQTGGSAPAANNFAAPNFDPVATFRALKQSSRIQPPLAANPFGVSGPFGAPQPFALPQGFPQA